MRKVFMLEVWNELNEERNYGNHPGSMLVYDSQAV